MVSRVKRVHHACFNLWTKKRGHMSWSKAGGKIRLKFGWKIIRIFCDGHLRLEATNTHGPQPQKSTPKSTTQSQRHKEGVCGRITSTTNSRSDKTIRGINLANRLLLLLCIIRRFFRGGLTEEVVAPQYDTIRYGTSLEGEDCGGVCAGDVLVMCWWCVGDMLVFMFVSVSVSVSSPFVCIAKSAFVHFVHSFTPLPLT